MSIGTGSGLHNGSLVSKAAPLMKLTAVIESSEAAAWGASLVEIAEMGHRHSQPDSGKTIVSRAFSGTGQLLARKYRKSLCRL
jgi:hypothetical protein